MQHDTRHNVIEMFNRICFETDAVILWVNKLSKFNFKT